MIPHSGAVQALQDIPDAPAVTCDEGQVKLPWRLTFAACALLGKVQSWSMEGLAPPSATSARAAETLLCKGLACPGKASPPQMLNLVDASASLVPAACPQNATAPARTKAAMQQFWIHQTILASVQPAWCAPQEWRNQSLNKSLMPSQAPTAIANAASSPLATRFRSCKSTIPMAWCQGVQSCLET